MAATLVDLSADDLQNVASYMNVRDRDLARSDLASGFGDGLFVAEGEVVVRVLASRRATDHGIRSLLIERRKLEKLRDLIDELAPSICVYLADQRVMDSVVGFPIHRGILALGERGRPLSPDRLLAGDTEHAYTQACDAMALMDRARDSSIPLVVGLVGITNHDNVGSIFRNAAAFGARGVLLDSATCDPLYRKALRVSVGSSLVVPFARTPSAEAMLDRIEAAGWEALALSGRGPEVLHEALGSPNARGTAGRPGLRPRGRVLLLGAEGEGLCASVLQRARAVRIAMAPGLDSLNVSAASAIALYEATRHTLCASTDESRGALD